MEIYNISCIRKIDITGIYYSDKNAKQCFIDFLVCRENWENHVKSSKAFITIDSRAINNQKSEKTHCVGKRNWFCSNPYYQFFYNEEIRFEIQPRKKFFDFFRRYWRQRYYPEFCRIENLLNSNGWHTFDLG